MQILKTVAELLDDAKIVYNRDIVSPTEQKNEKHCKKSPWTTFTGMGLKPGEQISFIFDENIKATISGERTVTFENKEYFLTPLAIILAQRTGMSEKQANNIGSGFDVFKYDAQDKTLRERWSRLNRSAK